MLPHLSEFVSIRQIKTLTYVPHQDGSAGVTLEHLNACVSPPLELRKLTIDLKKVPWGIPRVVTETFLCSCDPLQFEVSGLGLISMIQLPASLPWKRIERFFFRDAYTEDVLLEGGLPFSNPVDLFFVPTGFDPDSPENPLVGSTSCILAMLPRGKSPCAHIRSTHIWIGNEDVLALTRNVLARTKGLDVQCDLKRSVLLEVSNRISLTCHIACLGSTDDVSACTITVYGSPSWFSS